MTTQTQYFILQGRSNTDSSLIIKYDGRYAYWGSKSQTWISDSSLEQIADKFKQITESNVKKFIKTGVPPMSDYIHVNPKIDGMRI
jgi:hypothetical protein